MAPIQKVNWRGMACQEKIVCLKNFILGQKFSVSALKIFVLPWKFLSALVYWCISRVFTSAEPLTCCYSFYFNKHLFYITCFSTGTHFGVDLQIDLGSDAISFVYFHSSAMNACSSLATSIHSWTMEVYKTDGIRS